MCVYTCLLCVACMCVCVCVCVCSVGALLNYEGVSDQ